MPTHPAEWALFIACMVVIYAGFGLVVGLYLDTTIRYKEWANTDRGVCTIFLAWPVLILIIIVRFIIAGIKGFKGF